MVGDPRCRPGACARCRGAVATAGPDRTFGLGTSGRALWLRVVNFPPVRQEGRLEALELRLRLLGQWGPAA